MSKIVIKFVLAEDNFMPELDLRQPGFTYITSGRFTKHHEINHIYKNELDKACFAHDAEYSCSKDLYKRNVPGKILKDKCYEITINPNTMVIKGI